MSVAPSSTVLRKLAGMGPGTRSFSYSRMVARVTAGAHETRRRRRFLAGSGPSGAVGAMAKGFGLAAAGAPATPPRPGPGRSCPRRRAGADSWAVTRRPTPAPSPFPLCAGSTSSRFLFLEAGGPAPEPAPRAPASTAAAATLRGALAEHSEAKGSDGEPSASSLGGVGDLVAGAGVTAALASTLSTGMARRFHVAITAAAAAFTSSGSAVCLDSLFIVRPILDCWSACGARAGATRGEPGRAARVRATPSHAPLPRPLS